jgi:hypothetical protein
LILKIEGANVNVEKSAPSDTPFSYDSFVRDIKGVDEAKGEPQGHLEPRFGILDFKFDTPNGQRSKICCIAWCVFSISQFFFRCSMNQSIHLIFFFVFNLLQGPPVRQGRVEDEVFVHHSDSEELVVGRAHPPPGQRRL